MKNGSLVITINSDKFPDVMENKVTVEIQPSHETIFAKPGSSLQDILFDYGVEFPCGGAGTCGNCKIRLLRGNLEINDIQRNYFSEDELADGWRLACQCTVSEPVTLELAQWEMDILSDNQRLKSKGTTGFAVAIDLGTTTLVAQLIDLNSGFIKATKTTLNPQARYGADIMSRIEYAVNENGTLQLRDLIRSKLSGMILELIGSEKNADMQIEQIVIAGNTAMHHLFCGLDVTPLSMVPFKTDNANEYRWSAKDLGWNIPGNPTVRFLPCIGGFVGSDVLAGMLATEMHSEDGLVALVDLGTNGEVVVGKRQKFLCASTAAGPAFEGAKISMGMRATTGAISKVTLADGKMVAHVIGSGKAKGICGSGLVDAVACALESGMIDSSGRILTESGKIHIRDNVFLNQQDIRELQLAKAAIAAGVEILAKRFSVSLKDIEKVHIAGAFGNYINVENARKIGLLNTLFSNIIQSGNTSLHGTKLIAVSDYDYQEVLSLTSHVALGTDPEFMDRFVENMKF